MKYFIAKVILVDRKFNFCVNRFFCVATTKNGFNMIENRSDLSPSQFIDPSKIEFADYPMEVSVTKAALDRIDYESCENDLQSKIDVWVGMECEKSKRVCTLNSNFFGTMSEYSSAFDDCNVDLSLIRNKVISLYCKLKFSYNVMSVYLPLPRVEINSQNIPSLLFVVPSLKIESGMPIKVSIYDQRSFTLLSKLPECLHKGEKFIYLNPIYILGTFSSVDEFPMEVKFSASIAPNLLRMEMDYQNGAWRLAAIQRKLFQDES